MILAAKNECSAKMRMPSAKLVLISRNLSDSLSLLIKTFWLVVKSDPKKLVDSIY